MVSPESLCERWQERIEQALQAGLSVQRIYQDLIVEQHFAGSYHSVRRFVLRLRPGVELPFRRLESAGKLLRISLMRNFNLLEPFCAKDSLDDCR